MINIKTLNPINNKNMLLPQFSLFSNNLVENYNSQLDYLKIKKIEEEAEFNKSKFNLMVG
jgi:hypothetical protein